MWIKKIILENFAPFIVGVQSKHIEIDFSNRKNKICLILGPNGKGKTALLSNLTPFATVGNLDIRSSNDMIVKNESGYKEITIVNHGYEYIIKHFYTPSGDTHTVKSYISKDGEELNPQGTVRSFGLIVTEELGIEPEYLKLIRLGENVKNLIDLSSTDRKAFLGKLLEELDFYIKSYKKFSNMFTDTKKFIEKATYRLNKLEFRDKDLLKDEKERTEEVINRLKEKSNELRDSIVSSKTLIDELDPNGNISRNYKNCKVNFDLWNPKFKKSSGYYFEDCYEYEVVTSGYVEDKKEELTKLQMQLTAATQRRDMLLTYLDNSYKERNELSIKIKQIEEESDISSAKEIFFKLRVKLNELENEFENVTYNFTKEDVETCIITMQSIQDILDTTYNFGRGPVEKVIKLIRKDKDVHSYINTGLLSIPKSRDNNVAFMQKILKYYTFNPSVITDCPNTECPALTAYNHVRNAFLLDGIEKHKSDESEEFLTFMGLAHTNILTVLDRLKTLKDIIARLDDEYKKDFAMETIFAKISKLEQVFDIKKYNSLLSDITDYEIYLNTKEELKIAEANYNQALKRKNDSYAFQRFDEVNKEIERNETSLEDSKVAIITINGQMSEIQKIIEHEEENLHTYGFLRELYIDMDKYKTSMDRIDELEKSLILYESEYKKIEKELSHFNDRLTKLLVNEDNLKSIKKELKEYKERYDDLFYLKKASSTKEGIPLEYIELYLEDAKFLVNELLDIVYDGELYIDSFNVTADEFTIPYVKNGHKVQDIISASQGEQSFISTAISSALAYEQIKKYNIQLLDEVDGTLDPAKKEKFIPFLEKIMDRCNSEQSFLITHSGIFSSYPVDIVSIINKRDNSYTFGNFIEVNTSNKCEYC